MISQTEIRNKLRKNMGLGALFRFYRARLPYHGETLILTNILRVGVNANKKFAQATLNRVIRQDLNEPIRAEVRNFLHIVRRGDGGGVQK